MSCSQRLDYGTISRQDYNLEFLTDSDSTISAETLVTVIQAYNYTDPNTNGVDIRSEYTLPNGRYNGEEKIIELSDLMSTAKINMGRGSFILETDYPSAHLIWNATEGAWKMKKIGPPIFVGRQEGLKLVGTGFSGDAQMGSRSAISSDGNTFVIAGLDDDGIATQHGGAWVFTRNGTVWTQQGTKILGTGFSLLTANPNLLFGQGIDISGDGNTIAIGAGGDDGIGTNNGATWIFTRTGTVWTQQGEKLIGTGQLFSNQGNDVSLSADGNTLAVGGIFDTVGHAIGATWIFTRSGTVWTQQGLKLVGTGYSGDSQQGRSVELSADGNTLAIGAAADNNNNGATWIFTRSGTVWTQQGLKLVGTGFSATDGNVNQGIGIGLSADGNIMTVAGRQDDGPNEDAGAVWTFIRNGTVWTQSGEKLLGTGFSSNTNFGIAVSLSADGRTMAVSGEFDNAAGNATGATWCFTRNKENTQWIQRGTKFWGTGFSGTSIRQRSGFGKSLSASGNTLVVGGQGDDQPGVQDDAGAAWVFI